MPSSTLCVAAVNASLFLSARGRRGASKTAFPRREFVIFSRVEEIERLFTYPGSPLEPSNRNQSSFSTIWRTLGLLCLKKITASLRGNESLALCGHTPFTRPRTQARRLCYVTQASRLCARARERLKSPYLNDFFDAPRRGGILVPTQRACDFLSTLADEAGWRYR